MSKPTVTPPAYLVTQLSSAAPAPQPKTKRGPVDLERLKRDYETDRMTMRELGKLHGISHVRVLHYVKKLGWTRNIARQARALAERRMANPKAKPEEPAVLPATHPVGNLSLVTGDVVTPAVADAAAVLVGVRTRHRQGIERFTLLAQMLLAELEATTERPDLIAEMIKALEPIMDAEECEDTGVIRAAQIVRRRKLEEAVARATSTSSRTKTMKDLTDILKTLIGLERQAHDLDTPGENDDLPAVAPDRTLDPQGHYRWLTSVRERMTPRSGRQHAAAPSRA